MSGNDSLKTSRSLVCGQAGHESLASILDFALPDRARRDAGECNLFLYLKHTELSNRPKGTLKRRTSPRNPPNVPLHRIFGWPAAICLLPLASAAAYSKEFFNSSPQCRISSSSFLMEESS